MEKTKLPHPSVVCWNHLSLAPWPPPLLAVQLSLVQVLLAMGTHVAFLEETSMEMVERQWKRWDVNGNGGAPMEMVGHQWK